MHRFLLGVLVGIAGTIGTCLVVDKLETNKHSHCKKGDACNVEDEVNDKVSDSAEL